MIKVEAAIKLAARESAEPAAGHVQRGRKELKADLLTACAAVLQHPGDALSAEAAAPQLLEMAKTNATVAYVITSLGFKATTKFPAEFDYLQTCQLTFLHFSSFIEDAQASLKASNRANIESGSELAWKEFLANCQEMQPYHGLPVWNELLEPEDVFDSLDKVSRLRREMTDLEQKVRSSRTKPVQTGRAAPAARVTREITNLKRKLSDLSSQGDGVAEKALEKLTKPSAPAEDDGNQDGSGEGQGRKRRRRRVAIAKERYKRQSGDELRLLKKREIVPWWWK